MTPFYDLISQSPISSSPAEEKNIWWSQLLLLLSSSGNSVSKLLVPSPDSEDVLLECLLRRALLRHAGGAEGAIDTSGHQQQHHHQAPTPADLLVAHQVLDICTSRYLIRQKMDLLHLLEQDLIRRQLQLEQQQQQELLCRSIRNNSPLPTTARAATPTTKAAAVASAPADGKQPAVPKIILLPIHRMEHNHHRNDAEDDFHHNHDEFYDQGSVVSALTEPQIQPQMESGTIANATTDTTSMHGKRRANSHVISIESDDLFRFKKRRLGLF